MSLCAASEHNYVRHVFLVLAKLFILFWKYDTLFFYIYSGALTYDCPD